MRTCWLKHKHKHKRKSISQSASTNAYVNDVLTDHKHKHKKKAYAYVMAVLTSAIASYAYVDAYACVASEDQALWRNSTAFIHVFHLLGPSVVWSELVSQVVWIN